MNWNGLCKSACLLLTYLDQIPNDLDSRLGWFVQGNNPRKWPFHSFLVSAARFLLHGSMEMRFQRSFLSFVLLCCNFWCPLSRDTVKSRLNSASYVCLGRIKSSHPFANKGRRTLERSSIHSSIHPLLVVRSSSCQIFSMQWFPGTRSAVIKRRYSQLVGAIQFLHPGQGVSKTLCEAEGKR